MKAGTLSALAAAALAASAPAAEPVADGFMAWEGAVDGNFLSGQAITPSDLRHRTVVYVAVDDAEFTSEKIVEFGRLAELESRVASDVSWDLLDALPRDVLVVFSVCNAKTLTASAFAKRLEASSEMGESAKSRLSALRRRGLFYKNLYPDGVKGFEAERLPHVAVYGATGTEPVYEKDGYSKRDLKEVRAAVVKAAAQLPSGWASPLGVREPKFYPALPGLLAKGKTAADLQRAVKSGIKSKDAERAHEAQTVYDALNQYARELRLRIAAEATAAPVRAYCDFQELLRLYPAEKKRLAAVDQKIRSNKAAVSLGNIFMDILRWSRDDFEPKSAGEAKKIVQRLESYRKAIDGIAAGSNDAKLQGEASLVSTRIESLISVIPAKVRQK